MRALDEVLAGRQVELEDALRVGPDAPEDLARGLGLDEDEGMRVGRELAVNWPSLWPNSPGKGDGEDLAVRSWMTTSPRMPSGFAEPQPPAARPTAISRARTITNGLEAHATPRR